MLETSCSSHAMMVVVVVVVAVAVVVIVVVVVVVVMLLRETWLCLMRKVSTANCDVTAGEMTLIKLRLTVDWLSSNLLLLLLLVFIIIIIIVISHITSSIQAVSIQHTVAFEAPDRKDDFLAPGKGSVIMSSSSVTLEDLLA